MNILSTCKQSHMLFAGFLPVFLSLLYVGCASSVHSDRASVSLSVDKGFYRTRLSNGIPVVIRERELSDTAEAVIVIDGGVPLVPSEQSGLERVTLECMQRNSDNVSFVSDVYTDYSVFGFTSNTASLYSDLSVLAARFVHPEFDMETVRAVLEDARLRNQVMSATPSRRFAMSVKQLLYTNHPYASLTDVTKASLNYITAEEIAANHSAMVNAARLSIIIVGSLDEKAAAHLVLQLERLFGKIPLLPYTRPDVPPLTLAAGTTAAIPAAPAGEAGYILGCFTIPSYSDSDYIPFAIATMIFNDMLRHSVRDRNRAAESVGVGILNGRQAVGVVSVYKAADTTSCRKLVLDTIEQFPDSEGIEDLLAEYKQDYVNVVSLAAKNVTGETERLAASLEYLGDAAAYTRRVVQINAVTADQIYTAFRAYIHKERIHWYTAE